MQSRRHWKVIAEYPDYIISPNGEVYSRTAKRDIVSRTNARGELVVRLTDDGFTETLRVEDLLLKTYTQIELHHRVPLTNQEYIVGLNRSIYVIETKQIFNSQSECAQALGVSSARISKVVNSNGVLTVKGYHLKRFENQEEYFEEQIDEE